MDTTEVAEHLGTSPRVLRQFLRSPVSTFQAVGSGARYDFTERDLPMLKKRFGEWNGVGKPKPPAKLTPRTPSNGTKAEEAQRRRDEEVWASEGPVVIEDIRDPRVRRRVQAAAKAAEDLINMQLLAAGLHVTQLGDQRAAS